MNRRRILAATVLTPLTLLLARCASGNSATVQAQVIADIQGLQGAVAAVVSVLNVDAPGAISADAQTKITNAEGIISAALAALSSSTPIATGATVLQQVNASLMTALQIIGAALPAAQVAFPQIASIVPIYDAAVALMPILQAYIMQIISQVNPAAPPVVAVSHLTAVKSTPTPANARAILGIKTV